MAGSERSGCTGWRGFCLIPLMHKYTATNLQHCPRTANIYARSSSGCSSKQHRLRLKSSFLQVKLWNLIKYFKIIQAKIYHAVTSDFQKELKIQEELMVYVSPLHDSSVQLEKYEELWRFRPLNFIEVNWHLSVGRPGSNPAGEFPKPTDKIVPSFKTTNTSYNALQPAADLQQEGKNTSVSFVWTHCCEGESVSVEVRNL